ncbi:MAG: argininosuccinate lyase [Leptospira sp.]|nr:argininosuccinate lyase [Leptospira sp.]
MYPVKSRAKKKLWGGRFDGKTSSVMERIGESISFDKRLYKQDIRAGLAHAKMLSRIGVLSAEEFRQIESGLAAITKEIEEGNFRFIPELEDIHMHIEYRLTELKGDVGKKLHTARSRNDQVAQDVRLFIMDEIKSISPLLITLLEIIVSKAKNSVEIIMPGFTHLQVAQPLRASHYLLSYFWAFFRDFERIRIAYDSCDSMVLGSGALAGVNYKTDRLFMQKELGLSSSSENSIDAVSNRDYILEFLFAASQFMIHASRLCEEIIIFSSVEFGFISLPDSLTTGSSIMPQKKNPDIAELIRSKSSRVIANLNHVMILLKGLPMAYNRDLQEDKIPLFDTTDQLRISIEGISEMISGLEFQTKNLENSLKKGYATATDLADYLVSVKKIPFREAHELVGRLVSVCVTKEKNLFDIGESDRKKISEHFSGDGYFSAISLENSADKKDVFGGTAKKRQIEQISLAERKIKDLKKIKF